MYDGSISETIIKFLNRCDDSYHFERDDVIMDFTYTRGGWIGFISCEKYIMIMKNANITVYYNDPLLTKDLMNNISNGYIGNIYGRNQIAPRYYELYMSKMFKNTCIPHKVSLLDKLIELKDLSICDNKVIDVITKYIFVGFCHGYSIYDRVYHDELLNIHACYAHRYIRTWPRIYGYIHNYETIVLFSGIGYGSITVYKYNDRNAKILSKMCEKITDYIGHKLTESIVLDVTVAEFLPKFNKTKSARNF